MMSSHQSKCHNVKTLLWRIFHHFIICITNNTNIVWIITYTCKWDKITFSIILKQHLLVNPLPNNIKIKIFQIFYNTNSNKSKLNNNNNFNHRIMQEHNKHSNNFNTILEVNILTPNQFNIKFKFKVRP